MASSSNKPAKPVRNAPDDPKIRPGAGGHRFGPDLQCSECGQKWDAHQQHPEPCGDDEPEVVAKPAERAKAEQPAAKAPKPL